jgi:uncharacterized membrane protein
MKTIASSFPAAKTVQIVLQGLAAVVFLVAGVLNLADMLTEEMARLGYPGYFSTIIGAAYIIGVVCIYQPRFVFLQDWAFGAMMATLVGAASTHILVGDPIGNAAPATVTLAILLVAYVLRERLRED